MSLEEQCRHEVVALHRFFQDWFNGELPETDEAFARFAEATAPGFLIVTPDGRAHARDAILEVVRGAHGRGGFTIDIRNHVHRDTFGDVALVTYEEWQTTEAGERGRASSALLRTGAARPLWLHVHETWLE